MQKLRLLVKGLANRPIALRKCINVWSKKTFKSDSLNSPKFVFNVFFHYFTGPGLGDEFIVGLSNTKPETLQKISLNSYTLCGKYKRKQLGEEQFVVCAAGLQKFRYVIVQVDSGATNKYELSLCGIQVVEAGKIQPIFW